MFRSRKSKVLAALTTGLLCSTAYAQTCQVSVEQTVSNRWASGDDDFSLVQVDIKNTGSSPVSYVNLEASSEFQSFWEMLTADSGLELPEWRAQQGIAEGESHSWGYIIQSADAADLTVSSVECVDGEVADSEEQVTSEEAATSEEEATSEEQTTSEEASDEDAIENASHGGNNNNNNHGGNNNGNSHNSRPTRQPTKAPTRRPTKAPTTRPTKAPTQAPTRKPTKAPTQKPTKAPTDAPTRRPTNAPTSRPTNTPTTKPTNAPTTKPTSTPTTKPTTAPTTRPTSSGSNGGGSNGRICPAGQVWSPTPGTTWEWQLTGTINTGYNVQMYDIDLFDNDASVIQNLHSQGRVVICYFSTQYENWRPDASSFTAAVLGSNLDDWPGERYVDIRSTVVRNIMSARLDLALSKGCDGVEPDNVDGYTNSNGFGLTAADQLSFNKFLAQQAHARGLSVGLKNDLDQASSLQPYFDWALNEQCNQYSECDMLDSFNKAGKAVFGVEYSGKAATFCPKMVSAGFSWLLKDLDLDGTIGAQCCTYASGGCAPAPYSCKTPTSSRSLLSVEEAEVAPQEEAAPTEEVYESSASSSFMYSFAFLAAAAFALIF